MILITGGGGFLGLNVARSLADKGLEVLLVQRHSIEPPPILGQYWGAQVRQEKGNVLDLPFLLSVVKEYRVESIIHGAFDTGGIGTAHALRSGLHQVIQVELEGSINVLEVARNAALHRVTLISSVDCYRGFPSECAEWHEDAFLPPVSYSPIATSKRASEQIGFLYSKTYGFDFVALRVGRVYGPGARSGPIKRMVEAAAGGRPADLSDLSGSTRTHTVYAKDVGLATGMVHLAESPRHKIYNISDGTNPTLLEIARVVQALIPGATITLGPSCPDQSLHSGIDVNRMKEEFGFVFRDTHAGIADYIHWIKNGHR